jgi:hypothetical protein
MSEKYKVIDSTVPTIRDFKKYTSKKINRSNTITSRKQERMVIKKN